MDFYMEFGPEDLIHLSSEEEAAFNLKDSNDNQKVYFKSFPNGTCPMLGGEVGQKCSCKIYERRPRACQWFTPGSDDCLFIRRKSRIEV